MLYPKYSEFVQLSRLGCYFPFVREIESQAPIDFYRATAGNNVPAFLLESQRFNSRTGRYSFVLPKSFMRFRSYGDQVILERDGRVKRLQGSPFEHLKQILQSFPVAGFRQDLPPFVGGAAGLLAYELKNQIEKRVYSTYDPYHIPDMDLGFFDEGIVIDHLEKRTFIFVLERSDSIRAAYARAMKRLEFLFSRIAHVEFPPRNSGDRPVLKQSPLRLAEKPARLAAELRAGLSPEFRGGECLRSSNKNRFIEMVIRAKEYIRQGDVFQVNLSHCIETDFSLDPLEAYKRHSQINPSPFSAFAQLGDYQILCGSPERLLSQRGGRLSTRPIAGTRPRSDDARKDEALARELFLSPKERAEHIMLIDLERNDLGRVCEYGSVRVNEMMVLENYSHVRHIISNVQGRLKQGKDIVDALKAVFPGGTITGAPKVRAMEIIDELEGVRRGPYTGSLGYMGFNRHSDWNIVIRSLLVKNKKAFLQVGAGIVQDSKPENEYKETLDKAQAFLQTLEVPAALKKFAVLAH